MIEKAVGSYAADSLFKYPPHHQRPPCAKAPQCSHWGVHSWAVSRKADWGIVGTLKKHAGGMFLVPISAAMPP